MQYAGSVQLDSPLPPQVQGQVADQIKRARDVMVAEATDAPAAAAAPPPVAARRRRRRPPRARHRRRPPRRRTARGPAKTEVHLGNRGSSSSRPSRRRTRPASPRASPRSAPIFGSRRPSRSCLRRRVPRVAQPGGARQTLGDIGVTARLQRRRVMLRARAREVGVPPFRTSSTRRFTCSPRRLLCCVRPVLRTGRGAAAGADSAAARSSGGDRPSGGFRDVGLAVLAAPGRASTPRRHGRLRQDPARPPCRAGRAGVAAAASRPSFGTPAGR